MGKREDFKKGLAVLGITGAIALSNFTAQKIEDQRDMSKYNIDNNKYEDYMRNDLDKKVLDRLEENVNTYKELISKSNLDKSEKEELKMVSEDLKKSMSSGYLADFYLKNVFKEKLKSTYKADKIITTYDKDGINIKLYDRFGKFQLMDRKDQVLPIQNAMRDIVMLQGYEEKESFSKSELDNFVKAYENMKGFSNIHFIKLENKPLTYAEMDLDRGEENSL